MKKFPLLLLSAADNAGSRRRKVMRAKHGNYSEWQGGKVQ